MIDFEGRITETLHRHAPTFVTTMPKGTVARVRVRQAITSVTALAVAAGLVVAGVGALSAAPTFAPADRQTVPAPTGVLPNLQGQADGTNDATPAPSSGPTAREDTTAHGTSSTEPYTEQVIGQEAYLLTQKHVVAFGHVSGIEWSLAAYDTKAYSGNDFTAFLGGSCGDLMVGDQGEYGGITFCLNTDETSADAAFAMAGFGNDLDAQAGPIRGYAGLVGPDVATVELRLADGDTQELALYDAPVGIDARYFEVFLSPGSEGRIVALGADGTELGAGQLCRTEPPDRSTNVGCGHGLVEVSSIVTTESGEPAP